MTKSDIIKRLAYIKLFYRIGVEQSKQAEALAFTCVLTIHDAIDWFMNLACLTNSITEAQKLAAIVAKDSKRKGKTNVYLMDYFTILTGLKHEADVNNINTLRNNLKHKFILPSQLGISETVNTARIFFEDNTKVIFSLNFDEISVVDLISSKEIKQLLTNAVEFQNKKEIENCVKEISKAYYELWQIDVNYIRSKKQFSYIDIYSIPHLQIPQLEDKPEIQMLKSYIDSIINAYNRNFQELNDSMKVFALGIEYRKFLKFKSLIPSTSIKDSNGIYHVTKPNNLDNITNNDLTFAIDFLVDCTLHVEKFRL